MTYLKKSHYLLVALFAMTTNTVMCMDQQQPNAQQDEEEQKAHTRRMGVLNEEKLEAKTRVYIRDNGVGYRMVSTIGDHATRGFMEFCAKTASDSVLEVVKKELDIRYDNDPTVARQLDEIASGITIIHNAVNLSDELAKKETAMAKYLTSNNPVEQKKRQAEIDADIDATLRGLRHLRNEHIDQLNAVRQKRNPNFKPYSQQK
jgi:hypothetical protein